MDDVTREMRSYSEHPGELTEGEWDDAQQQAQDAINDEFDALRWLDSFAIHDQDEFEDRHPLDDIEIPF